MRFCTSWWLFRVNVTNYKKGICTLWLRVIRFVNDVLIVIDLLSAQWTQSVIIHTQYLALNSNSSSAVINRRRV